MKRVKVYWNLHKKCFSVQHRGKVIMHVDNIVLHDAEFKVSESGRQRVLREKRKNVHAFVVGIYDRDFNGNVETPFRVTYNPYKYDSFVFDNTKEPLYNADVVKCVSHNRKGELYVN